jgi:hypothetical protein
VIVNQAVCNLEENQHLEVKTCVNEQIFRLNQTTRVMRHLVNNELGIKEIQEVITAQSQI